MKTFRVGRRKIGVLDKGVYFKEVTKSKHLFRILDAWGIDSETINKLPKDTKIKIHDLEEDIIYTTTKEKFKQYGQYYHFKEEVQDHRTQLFLSRKNFDTEKPPVLTQDEQDKQAYMKAMGLL